MVRKAKVYGKQKTNELVTALEKLDIHLGATPPEGPGYIDISEIRKRPLTSVTGNARRAARGDDHELNDGESGEENESKIDTIPDQPGTRVTARSAENVKGPAQEPKPTRGLEVKRSFSFAKKEDVPSAKISDPFARQIVLPKVKGSEKTKGKEKRTAYNPDNEITALTSLTAVDNGVKETNDMFKTWQGIFTVAKIAQGSFGSILRTQMRSNPSNFTVCKLMPIMPREGSESDGGLQTYIKDAAAEVKVLDTMGESPGFVQFRSAYVLEGKLPKFLVNLLNDWDRDHPKDKTPKEHRDSQLWLLIEMSDAGTDLATVMSKGFPDGTYLNRKRKGSRLTLHQTWDIFWGVAEALAHGEINAEFEHRDLHPGNICIKKRAQVFKSASNEEDFNLAPRYTDLEVTIIDYTLSRVTLEGGNNVYNNMDDEGLFEGQSKNDVDHHQYNTYRDMRDIVGLHMGLPLKNKIDNLWALYYPKSNLLWLRHLLYVLLKETERVEAGNQILAETLTCIQSKLNLVMTRDCIYNGARELVEAYMDGANAIPSQ